MLHVLRTLIVGERGFGKSTLSFTLVEKYGYFLVTDELSIIYNRSSIIEPYPRPLGIWEEDEGIIRKINLPATSICKRELLIKLLILPR